MTYFSQQSANDTTPKLVAFICFGGMSSFDLSGACEAFADARIAEPDSGRHENHRFCRHEVAASATKPIVKQGSSQA